MVVINHMSISCYCMVAELLEENGGGGSESVVKFCQPEGVWCNPRGHQ